MSTADRPIVPTFEAVLGAKAEARADAPGRVNLIGEHTDYHDGFVLPAVIPQRTRAMVHGRVDRRVRAWSSDGGPGIEEYTLGQETRGRGWLDYVQGLTVSLAARGVTVPGFDLWLDSSVPIGGGVSSSAALELSVLRALRARFVLPLDDVELARVGQAAETAFVGAPVGIMDQMASSLGRDGEALFLDTRTLAVERIPLPPGVALIVIASGVTHAHAGGEYATRRRESFDAATHLGVERLRDLDTAALPRLAGMDAVLARRARHIITENQRVLDAADALREGDPGTVGCLMNASHESMRDDYQISTPEIDLLVSLAQAEPSVFGARLTGGGFGGSIVALARADDAAIVAFRVLKHYEDAGGRGGRVLLPLIGVVGHAF